MKSGEFLFEVTPDDVYTYGYAVSPDGNSYRLLGVGLTLEYETLTFFDYALMSYHNTERKVPIILYPGIEPSYPSPIQ